MVLKRHVVENLGDVPALLSGLLSERPAPNPALPGTLFVPTDEGKIYRDTGTGWDVQTDSAAMSAADILTAIKTVDGAGSGLDADTLDGANSGAFAAASHQHAGTDITTGQVPVARIATGTPTGTKFVRDDGTLAIPSGTGVTDHGDLTGLSDDDHAGVYVRYTIDSTPPASPRTGDFWLVVS